MSNVQIVNGDQKPVAVGSSDIEALAAKMNGELLQQGEDGYDTARTIWNAMIDRKPALIARCTGVADVILAINFARGYGLLTSIHGAGHNIGGLAVCEGGLMIDLSLMRTVQVDPKNKRAHVGPGATLGDLDHETQAFGLATPVGINSTTGVSGLTLGGGFGWLSRKYGMTVDALRAADVVTPNGEFVHCNDKENADLFWAIRGGGGNFGVVTRWEYELYPVGPEILAGLIVLPLKDAAVAMRKYRELTSTFGDNTNAWVILRAAPPLPFLPEEVHGTNVCVFAVFHNGNADEGRKALEPLRTFGTVLGEHVGTQPFTAWQKAFDPLLTPGARNYWKSHNFSKLSDEAIDLAVKYAGNLPSSECEIFFGLLGGEVGRIARDATAYPHRDAEYVMNVHARWQHPDDDDKCVSWSREFFDKMTPHSTGGVYINFMTEEETDRIGAAFGSSWDRLVKAKKKYDPSNLLRVNQNIKPS